MNAATSVPLRAPSWLLLGVEPLRAALEFAGAQLMDKTALPHGDGHPVVLFPGLASDQRALAPLKALCRRLGYPAQDWGRGFNTGPEGDVDAWLDSLAADVRTRLDNAAQGATLIGWSLGGIYAREVARRLGPARVRQVITIGTPFAGSAQHTHAGLAYRLLNGSEPTMDEALQRRLAEAPPVPTTSIYSRSDGVVAWQACLQAGAGRFENIEVAGSHCGLGWNAEVFAIIANRLAQPAGRWQPWVRA